MSYNLLKGKRGIIFGALNEQSIAWKVAEKAVEEGATITLSKIALFYCHIHWRIKYGMRHLVQRNLLKFLFLPSIR